ncbi:MAG: hypothetical protein ABID45_02965 [Patescibacteria group bacterium]
MAKIEKEKNLAKKLDQLRGKKEKDPNEERIIVKDHPEKQKLYILVGISTVIIVIIGLTGISLKMKYSDSESFGEKFNELSDIFSFNLTEDQNLQDEEDKQDKKEFISNPQNYSDEEIEEIEEELFPEIK